MPDVLRTSGRLRRLATIVICATSSFLHSSCVRKCRQADPGHAAILASNVHRLCYLEVAHSDPAIDRTLRYVQISTECLDGHHFFGTIACVPWSAFWACGSSRARTLTLEWCKRQRSLFAEPHENTRASGWSLVLWLSGCGFQSDKAQTKARKRGKLPPSLVRARLVLIQFPPRPC